MATPKTWTATDISKDGTIMIYQLPDGMLQFTQNYQFLDAQGAVIESLGDRQNRVNVAFADLPQNIKDALVAIQNNLYSIALTNEGMN